MTYRPWDEAERDLEPGRAALAQVQRKFLDSNPWLVGNVDFGACAGKRVLEIGCGAGAATCLFASSGAEVFAVDLTERAVATTQALAHAADLSVDAREMDAERLDFPDGYFDYVFSWGVLHHSSDPEAAIAEAGRVLRPEGAALIMVYNRKSLRYYGRGLQHLFLKGRRREGHNLASVQQFFTDGYYHWHFTRGELESMVRSAGMVPEASDITHMSKQMVPLLPRRLDELAKRSLGWLLVVRARKLP